MDQDFNATDGLTLWAHIPLEGARQSSHDDGSLNERGRTIVAHAPAGRFGEPEELVGILLWLCGPGAEFVNGVVLPVDGGFSPFGGV